MTDHNVLSRMDATKNPSLVTVKVERANVDPAYRPTRVIDQRVIAELQETFKTQHDRPDDLRGWRYPIAPRGVASHHWAAACARLWRSGIIEERIETWEQDGFDRIPKPPDVGWADWASRPEEERYKKVRVQREARYIRLSPDSPFLDEIGSQVDDEERSLHEQIRSYYSQARRIREVYDEMVDQESSVLSAYIGLHEPDNRAEARKLLERMHLAVSDISAIEQRIVLAHGRLERIGRPARIGASDTDMGGIR